MNNRDFERERRSLLEEMYMNDFNNYLYRQGMISNGHRNRTADKAIHRALYQRQKRWKWKYR